MANKRLSLACELDQYAVMGNPIAHSKSPFIHTAFARETGQTLIYKAILVDRGNFAAAIANFHTAGGRGVNITVPFKTEAYMLTAEHSPRAHRARAVNTLSFLGDGRICGDNTDGVGLIRDLTTNLGISLAKIRLLILGAGGAARGILQPLLMAGPNKVFIANRSSDRARELAMIFSDLGNVDGGSFDDLHDEQFDFVINATSASLEGQIPPLPDRLLADGATCYDLMYSNTLTPFLSWAINHGATKIADGLGMLVEQAAAAFFLWRGVYPTTATIIRELRGSNDYKLGGKLPPDAKSTVLL